MEKIINTNIQYDENIFYLKQILNSIEKGTNSNINRELFHKKIREDFLFVDKCKNILLEKLIKNDKLISRIPLLQSISTLIDKFGVVTTQVIEKKILKGDIFSDIIKKNREDSAKIEEILFSAQNNNIKEDLTTNKELNILLMDNNFKDE